MFRQHTNEILYFSTTVEFKINGVVYRPSICYQVPPMAKASLEKFEAKDKVKFHKTPVRFVNGAIAAAIEKQPVASVASVAEAVEIEKTTRKKNK